VRDLIETGAASARAILERRRSELEAGVELLMTRETLTAEDFPPLRPPGQRDSNKPAPKAVA
jgi:cell division protease FtsH